MDNIPNPCHRIPNPRPTTWINQSNRPPYTCALPESYIKQMITKIEHTESPLIPAAITLACCRIIHNETGENDVPPSTSNTARTPPETKISEEDFLFDGTYEDEISEGRSPTHHTTPNTQTPIIPQTQDLNENTNIPIVLCKP